MIQYIVAAGLGALIGSAQKGKKNYRKGGSVMKKDPATKREILRESDGIMDDADDLIRIADKKRLDRDDKMGIQTLADEMKFRAGNIYDTAQRKLAKGGTTSDKPKVTSISEALMKMDGEVVQWEDMDNARLMFGPAMNAQDVADALIEHDIFLEEYAPELYEGYMEDDTDLFVHDGITPTLKDSVDIDDIVDAIEDHRKIKGDNSYNYSAPFVFDYKYVQTDDPYDEQLYFVREHRGGDVRGNYGQYMAFQLDSVEEHPLYGRISVYLETDKGDVTLDSESIEGYNYEVINDETGTFEEYENVNADDIEEAFDFGKLKSDALNIFARGGRTKRRKMAQGGLAIHFDDDYTHKDEIENLLRYKTYMRDNENLTDYGDSFYVYADDISPSGVRDVYNSIVEEGYDDNVELRPFAKGGKTQGYNARLDESLAMRRGSKRTKKQGYKSRRHESEGMERSMGRRKYASVGTMDKGRRKMARGGTIVGAGKSGLDKIKKTSKENPSQMYMVTDDNYTNIGRFYLKNGKFAKKTVANADYDFFHNKVSLRPKSDVIYKAIEIEGKGGYYAKGGCTSCGKRGRKMADGGRVGDKEYVLDHYYVFVDKDDYEEGMTDQVANWDSSDYGESNKSFSSKSALMDFIKEVIDRDTSEDDTKESNFDIESDEDGTTINYGVLCKYNNLGRGYDHYEKATPEEIEQWKKGDLELFAVGFTFKVKVYEPRKRAEFARGGKTPRQAYGRRKMADGGEISLDILPKYRREQLLMYVTDRSIREMDLDGQLGALFEYGYHDIERRFAGNDKALIKAYEDKTTFRLPTMEYIASEFAKGGKTMDKGRRKMEDGGMVEYLLYGVAKGKPEYMEKILFVDDKPIRITEKLRDMASAKGFDRLRTSMVDLKIAPDFTKALNFKKGGKTKGRKKVSDFDKLAMKVAARYRAQGMSNKKAMEIGRGTAGKVARQQQAKKRKK